MTGVVRERGGPKCERGRTGAGRACFLRLARHSLCVWDMFFRVCAAQPLRGGHATCMSLAWDVWGCCLGFAWPSLCVEGMLLRVCAAPPVRVGYVF